MTSLWAKLYRCLFKLFPAEFRDEYGGEMARLFRDRCRREGVPRVLFEALPDLVMTAWREHMDTLWNDIRYCLRTWRSSPGFVAVAILSLALGIGANNTIFSVLNALLLRPLAYKDPDRLVVLWEVEKGQQGGGVAPILTALDWKEQSGVFEDFALVSPGSGPATLLTSGEAQRVTTQDASRDLFRLLGVMPVLGHDFSQDAGGAGSRSVVLSDSFWKRRYNSDPGVIGTTFVMDGRVCVIAGVMPPGFSVFHGRDVDVWAAATTSSAVWFPRRDHWLAAIGRLKPGVEIPQAQTALDVVSERLEQQFPESNKNRGALIQPLHSAVYGWAPGIFYPLQGAVGLVLLIACANVANLLLARTAGRHREIALRASLGAGRARLVRQLLTESMLLGAAGGLAGVGVTFLGIRVFRAIAGGWLRNPDLIRVDSGVLLFTLAISLFTGILFGLAPALQASKLDLSGALKEGGRGTAGRAPRRLKSFFVVSEIALALVLLAAAGLMINSVARLYGTDPGFDPHNVLTMQVHLAGPSYTHNLPKDMKDATPQVVSFYRRLVEQIEAMPGVESVGFSHMPPTQWMPWRTFHVLGQPEQAPDARPWAGCVEVSPGFFGVLRIPLIRGRFLEQTDNEGSPWAAVINETFARQFFPNEDPIGKHLRFWIDPNHPYEEPQTRQIVGIVGDVKHNGLAAEASPVLYMSYLQQPEVYPGGTVNTHLLQTLLIRMAGGSDQIAGLIGAVQRAVAELDSEQPLYNFRTMEEIISQSMSSWKFPMQLLGIFASLALALAAVGIYGLMSHTVSERTHEIGVRMALGARNGDVLRAVMKHGLVLTAIGLGFGLAGAWAATRLIAGFLFGVEATDPLTFVTVSLVLAAVAVAASYIPARRAMKVDPIVALRCE